MTDTTQIIESIEETGHGAYVENFDPNDGRMVINMGPVHPATHGVLRLLLELDGETVLRCEPIIGYLHTGMEKEAEDQNWRGAVTIVTRMDYLAQFFNEQAYSMAVEKLLGIEVPPRGKYIRTLFAEVNRLTSHLVWFGTQALDMGAMSGMFYGFREREVILDWFEMVTGLRMNNGYIIPGGVWEDLPEGWDRVLHAAIDKFVDRVDEYEELLSENPIFLERTRGIGVISGEKAEALGATGPILRASGVDSDNFTDAAGAAHDGKEVVTGGQKVSVDLHGVAGDLSSRHRVTLADCAADCTFGPVGFAPFSSSK
jgi:NADH-quinone oxidoreductase subunit D